MSYELDAELAPVMAALAAQAAEAPAPARGRGQLGLENYQRFGDRVSDRHARIQAGERILEDNLQLAALRPHYCRRALEQIKARQFHAALLRPQQAQQGPRHS